MTSGPPSRRIVRRWLRCPGCVLVAEAAETMTPFARGACLRRPSLEASAMLGRARIVPARRWLRLRDQPPVAKAEIRLWAAPRAGNLALSRFLLQLGTGSL